MKLLLTSGGLTNERLRNAVRKLVGSKKIQIAFIPTAANTEAGDKHWLIRDYNYCMKVGTVDIIDISAVPKDIWLPRLKQANVIVVGGGKTSHLMKWIVKSGLKKELPSLLKTRVYVGISAGSMVTNKSLQTTSEFLYGDEEKNAPSGLGYVNFYVRPHLNSPHFPRVRLENIEKLVYKLDGDVYALDDDCAVQVVDGKVTVVGEGKWKLFEK